MELLRKMRAAMQPQKPQKSRPKLPKRELAPVADIVEQGLLVADVAVRMTVKNKLIVRALKHKADYSAEQTQEQVRQALTELIAEREKDAANIAIMRSQIKRVGFASGGEAEYHREDSQTLRHRQEVYEGVAAELKARAADHVYLASVAKKATELAWAEIGESIAQRAQHPYYSGGDNREYQAEREGRIQELIANDLQQLINSRNQQAEKPNSSGSWLAKFLNKKSQG